MSDQTFLGVAKKQLRSFLFVTGGINFKKREVSDRALEINLQTKFVFKMKTMPVARFAHGATFCR